MTCQAAHGQPSSIPFPKSLWLRIPCLQTFQHMPPESRCQPNNCKFHGCPWKHMVSCQHLISNFCWPEMRWTEMQSLVTSMLIPPSQSLMKYSAADAPNPVSPYLNLQVSSWTPVQLDRSLRKRESMQFKLFLMSACLLSRNRRT